MLTLYTDLSVFMQKEKFMIYRRDAKKSEAIYFLMNQEKAKEMGFIHCEVEDEVDGIIR